MLYTAAMAPGREARYARPVLRYITIPAAIVACAACASAPAGPRQGAGSAEAMRTVAQYRSASYRISPADLLSVVVYPDTQLNRKARVDADGAISLPLIGTTTVAGSTVLDAQRALERRLSSYLVSPHVTLFVEEYGNRQMFVLGEVQNPGAFAIPAGSRLTVLQAITLAGGFTKVAAPRRTHVLRYVDGRAVERVLDLKAIARGGQGGQDVVLEPNDVIYVPQSVF